MKKILLFISIICYLSSFALAQLQQDLSLKYLVQLPTEKSSNAPVIILLHGYGSNEADLFGLKEVLPKKYIVASARAPYPVGPDGFQWFNLNNLDDQPEIGNSRSLIVKFIDGLITKYKADRQNVYLIGFSQGAMMSYDVGLYNPGKVKGIAPLSGRIFSSVRQNIKNASPQMKQLRVFIAHGAADNRINVAEGRAANSYLKSMGLKPEYHEYAGMGHTISNDVLRDLAKWLQ